MWKQASGATFHTIIRFKMSTQSRSCASAAFFSTASAGEGQCSVFYIPPPTLGCNSRALQPLHSCSPLFYSLPFFVLGFTMYLFAACAALSISVTWFHSLTLQMPPTNKSWVATNDCHCCANNVITINDSLASARTNAAICCLY